MSRKANSNLLDYGIEEEVDPKVKFDSLISVTVSTIMCLAAKCPLPKSNIETTKLFLSTITDENGERPRNVKGFLSLLNDYAGPYEANPYRDSRFEKPPMEKAIPEKEKKVPVENDSLSKESGTSQILSKEMTVAEGQAIVKRTTKTTAKKTAEKEQNRKGSRSLSTRISASKSMINSKS